MNKYKIEGGKNFFEELYKSLDIEESEEKTEDDKNNCLITNQPLTDKHVELNCGHKFNYIPLYHDILNHKKKFNTMEGTVSRLHTNEIRCPYCRKKQAGVLPYYPEFGFGKVSGVNFYDPNKQTMYSGYKSIKCEYQLLNKSFDPAKPESNDNKKYLPCASYYATKIEICNPEKPLHPITYGDNKCYCYTHKKQMIKDYKIKEKEKQQEIKKQEKELIKAAKQKAKEEEKLAKKKIIKHISSENVVLGPSIVELEETNGCIQILKTGPNKGNPCGCKIFENNLCKRHMPKN